MKPEDADIGVTPHIFLWDIFPQCPICIPTAAPSSCTAFVSSCKRGIMDGHVKYTSLSFYEKGMIVCRGKNMNGSLIVENTATNHDDEVEREKIEALAKDLTELAKQIS